MPNFELLLIEGDEALNRQLEAHLTGHGYTVHVCTHLWAAEALLERWIPDVVLLDVLLPDGSGERLIPMIRSLGKPTLLAMGTQIGVEGRVKALDLGADGFLMKPFTLPELDACLQALLRRQRAAGQRLTWLEVTLDINRKMLTFEGREVPLTDQETQILCELMRSPGRVVSRKTLEEQIFGWSVPHSNTLEVRVSQLRKKLREVGCPFSIRGLRGVGYALSALG